ncbi:hypothetical protein ACL1BW_08000 [Corynebacterium striatum]
MHFILFGDESAPFFVSGSCALFVVANAIQARKREVERTVVFYVSDARLCDMGACAVLSLVFFDDFPLGSAEIFTAAVLVFGIGLPSVELPCYLIFNIRSDDLNAGSRSV